MADGHDEGTAASPPHLITFYEEDEEGFVTCRSWGMATKVWCALIRPLGGQRVELGWYRSIADAEEATGWCCDWDLRRVMTDSDVEAISPSPGETPVDDGAAGAQATDRGNTASYLPSPRPDHEPADGIAMSDRLHAAAAVWSRLRRTAGRRCPAVGWSLSRGNTTAAGMTVCPGHDGPAPVARVPRGGRYVLVIGEHRAA